MEPIQAGRAPGEIGQRANGPDRGQSVDSWLPGREAHGFLSRPRIVVPVPFKNSSGISRHHLCPFVVDGVRDGGGAIGAGRQDQVLDGQHAQRIPYPVSYRGHREVPGIRGGTRCLHGHDPAPHPHAAAAHSGHRGDSADGDFPRADVYGGVRAQHDGFHD